MNCKETLKECDDLNLNEISFPDIPEDIIFPQELNRYLREQLRYFMHENGMLKKDLYEKGKMCDNSKNQIEKLESKLKQYEDISRNEYVGTSQVASCKIVELTKKLREKNVELQSFKTKYSKLEKHITEIKKQLESNEKFPEVKTEVNVVQQEDEIKKLQDKLNTSNSKLTEMRNLNLQLRNELKIALKILQQETGENVDCLQNIINNSSNTWRGRSQIICDLHQKNAELKEKLKSYHATMSSAAVNNELKSETSSKLSLLSQENNDLKSSCDITKKKFEAAKARCKVLDNELTSLKTKFLLLNEQTQRDQDDILGLKSQLSSLEQSKKDILRQKENTINKLQAEKQVLNGEIEHLKHIIMEMKLYTEKSLDDLKHEEDVNKNSPRYKDENTVGRLEVEKMKLVELLEIQNKRLTKERELHAKTQLLLRLEKQSSAKLEVNLARMELETKSYVNLPGYSSNSQTNLKDLQTYKNELELANENLKVLKTRLEIEQQERQLDFQHFVNILNELRIEYSKK